MVVATAHSPEWASAWRTPDESGPNISRVMRTNFGDTTAKIFREYSDSLGFWFIVIEKSAPYVVSTYKLDTAALEKGKEDFKHLLKCYQICLKTNHWPAYMAQKISLPNYAFNKEKQYVSTDE